MRVSSYFPVSLVGGAEFQIPLWMGLWDTAMRKPLEVPKGAIRFESGFWALPGHLGFWV